MITILGSINMDLIATTLRLPKPGETVVGKEFSTAAGGKGANQALAARRAGAKVAMAGAVGHDAFADGALALLKEAGTNLDQVHARDGATGTALILVGDDGENMIAVVPAANGTVSVADAEAAVAGLGKGDYLMLQHEVPAETVEAALKAARAAGVVTVLNTAPLTADAARLSLLADIIISNETEFELLLGVSSLSAEDRVAEMLKRSAATGQTVIVTLGGDGVVAVRDGTVFKALGLKIEPVDTVGAGDTFCGYLVASLDAGLDFPASLRRAAVAGSLACLKAGAQPSIPVGAEVQSVLNE